MLSGFLELIHNPWIYWTLTLAYIATIISIVGVVLSENRNPLKSLAWVTVLLMFPIGGLVLYIFFGRSIKNQRMISRRNRRKLMQREEGRYARSNDAKLPPEHRQLVELGRSLTGSPFYPGNDVTVYHFGRDKFAALLADIESARSYIHLQYYIIEDDTIGTRVCEALMRKARQGVKVRVIYDHIGSIHVSGKFFKRMREAGVEVYPFFRVAFPPFATRINWRNHRKLCVIDGRVGYIGGMNVADRYVDGGKDFAKWRDTHLRITGPAIGALQFSFAVDWNFMGQPLIEVDNSAPLTEADDSAGMQMLTCGPTSEWSNIALLMLKAIGNAKKRICIQTPYFLPTESMLKVLQTAALARVDVRVMMPRKSDSRILTYASYSYIFECLRAGIKIFLYDGGMLHSKTLIIDDELSAVGSANIDFRSFEHNFEATMFIYSRKVNSELMQRFEADMEESTRIQPSAWRHRPMKQKAVESVVRLLSPVL
ncbi:MAG: cardiolipin synthase [Muribaculaceae bacterium]|nr:cardiolipin synthase [Muribaculaceae bacterium]